MSIAIPPIVALALNPWSGPWVNRQHLLSRVGRDSPVLYSTGGWFVWDRFDPEWKRAPMWGGYVRSDNVWVDAAPRWLLRWPRMVTWDRIAVGVLAQRWRRWARSFSRDALVAYVFHPAHLPYVAALHPRAVVYHAYDLFADVPGWTPALADCETQLLDRADLTIASSEAIGNALRPRVRNGLRILPNGVDLDAFARSVAAGSRAPGDLAAVPRPRIGYVGSLHPQVDFGLVAELATRRPGWHFVFVGGRINQKHELAERELEACRTLPNVHFLGYKGHDEIPAYLLNMDANIMCYRLAEGTWVNAGYPLKLHEYLAAGAPIVSADLDSVRAFVPLVKIVAGVDQWETALAEALAEDAPELRDARTRIAAQNGWDARARQLSSWLAEVVQRPPRARGF